MATVIGYARPGVQGSEAESQTATLSKAGAETVFIEQALSEDADRPELHHALDTLSAGDTLLVSSLDRLAHTPTELFYLLDEIRKRGAILRSLREDLTLGAKSAPGVPDDSSFMRHLGMILDFERAILKEWQRETIAAAKLRRESGTARRRR